MEENTGRPQRTRTSTTRANGYTGYSMIDDLGEESDAKNSSGNEWNGDDEEDDNEIAEEEEEISEDDSVANGEIPSLIVHLKYGERMASTNPNGPQESSAEKPEAGDQVGAGPAIDPEDIRSKEANANGAEETKPESLTPTMSESKPLDAPAPTNTDAEKEKPVLRNGANGV